MPATEKTWRDQILLHIAFAFSGLAMLIATVWMFAADHNREWKEYQRKLRTMDGRLTQWRYAQEADATQYETARLQAELLTIRSQAPDAQLYHAFKEAVQADAQRREVEAIDLDELDSVYENLQNLAAEAARRRESANSSAPAQEDQPPSAEQESTGTEDSNGLNDNETVQAEQRAAAVQEEFIDGLSDIVRRARFREDRLLGERKFVRADFDANRADLDLAIRDQRLPAEMDQLQAAVTAVSQQVAELSSRYEAAASFRERLQDILDKMTSEEQMKQKELEESHAELNRLTATLSQRHASFFTSSFPFLGKRVLELPILDAFNSPLTIDNLWTENLTIENGSFGKVRRFDRCTTCHRGIDKTMPGSADEPAYASLQRLQLLLATPDTRPQPGQDDQGQPQPATLQDVYGIGLADRGLIKNADVTIDRVGASSLAAMATAVAEAGQRAVSDAGLRVGDVFLYINGDKILAKEQIQRLLLETATWGQPIKVTVLRGLPNPYTSHPRLDLFLGSLSPHKLSDLACTICHEGQGSATAFKWASHTPNSPEQAEQWAREYGWFNNHHWSFPMFPKRFAESACLKCHHEVTELEPSERFPDPPAAKLLEGYDLVRRYGCFGCHEINGYDGPVIRTGPDLRLEPNNYAAAAAVKSDPGFATLSTQPQDWVEQLIQHPERDGVRHRLQEFLQQDATSETPLLTAYSHKMADVLQDVETAGRFRKVAPSLRYVTKKLGRAFLVDWIRRPNHFRPTTRMPQVFTLWNHLGEEERAVAQRNEPLEILGIVSYLLGESENQPWEYATPAEGVATADPAQQIARGKGLFETRGCLACHKHADFPRFEAIQGPDLSNVGDKLTAPGTPDGRAWLYTWLKSPTHYSPRTKMPDVQLEPITDAQGVTTDPAADIAAYLLASRGDWKPAPEVERILNLYEEEGPNALDAALEELALEHLGEKYYYRDAQAFLKNGIPEEMRADIAGAEAELLGQITREKKLRYLGRRTIAKKGCFGCHDIPGFEDAKPIGTALSDWGRKDPSKLAFEHIVEYLHHGRHEHSAEGGHAVEPTHGETDENDADDEFDVSFFEQRLEQHDRVGFIWQKLKEPHSYDYLKTKNKRYLERLRMPQFPFNNAEREAVITFVLGLVADPPAEEFVYHANPRQEALVQGRKVVDKFNCTGCHIFEPEKWDIEYMPGDFRVPPVVKDFPFVRPHFTPDQLNASLESDPLRGVLRATIAGMPSINDEDGRPMVLDDEGDPIEKDVEYDPSTLQYRFDLWEPVVVEGNVNQVGVLPLTVPVTMIKKKYPPLGGDLTLGLLPRLVELEKQVNPAAKGTEAWGWLPPPLIGEGGKVKPEWLHSFLLDPHMIRPAVVMRMPKFNMTPAEATKLVNYFAARDNAVYPYEFNDRSRDAHLASSEEEYRRVLAAAGGSSTNGSSSSSSGQDTQMERFEHAMRILTDSNYCIKCHIVADFMPTGSDRAKAPDLSKVYRRLRPELVQRWIANPKSILPYTSMPVNIPYDPDAPHLGGVSQDLYHGTSIAQLNALVDLLTNYDVYARARSRVAPLVKQAAPVAPTSGDSASGGETAGTGGR